MTLAGSDDVRPGRLAENVRERMSRASSPVNAYWMAVVTDRAAYAEALNQLVEDLPICVFVVRDVSFENPNAILADLIRILESNRVKCEKVLEQTGSNRIGVVLLSRVPLAVPQASSPVALPTWFPEVGGRTVSVVIEDMSWTTDAALNCEEANTGDICERLFDLEVSLLSRLQAAYVSDKQCADAFWSLIRREEDLSYGELLERFRESRNQVSNPSAFRPSLRNGASLIARLWAVGHQRNPEDHMPGKALARALALSDDAASDHESFASLIRRPSTYVPLASTRFARNALATIASACQLVTASAHADSYGRYPVALLVSYSFDLRRCLREIQQVLDQQPELHASQNVT